MLVPKTFQLAGVKWRVVQTPGLEDLGKCYRDKAIIGLQKEQEQMSKEIAFTHELVHAIKYTMGEGGPHDEKEVDAFAYLLHQYLNTAK
jgi:hypothetical protein